MESGFAAVQPPGPAAPDTQPHWKVGPPVPEVTTPAAVAAQAAVALQACAPGSDGAGVFEVPPEEEVVVHFFMR